jgi:regulator of sigma E protease
MYDFLTAVVSVGVVLGFMILIHEFGHYITAKWFGVRVEVFSIGFGRRLAGFRRGDTDYRISAIPLGGYVKMSGENPMEARSGDPGEFLSHPRWQRFVIAIAGPAMNVLLAIVLLTAVFMVHYEHPVYLDQQAKIGWVLDDTPAAKLGIEPGDRIARIEGIQNPTWEQVLPKIALSPNQPVDVTIQRGDQFLERTIVPTPMGVDQYGVAGWVEDQPNTITDLEPDMPAAKAGLKVGDDLVAVNGVPVKSMGAVIRMLQQNGDKPVSITVVRNRQQLSFTMQPKLTEVEGLGKRWRVGIQSDPQTVEQLAFVPALRKSLEENKKNSFLILELVQKMVRRKVSLRTIEGPIGIARASGEAARERGWTPLLALTAAISLNLGIFNLFPIPIMDGGVILLLLIEGVMRRDISLQIKERIYQAAFVFLVLFAVMVIYNDLMKALPGVAQRLP